jgi:hypothetical protein
VTNDTCGEDRKEDDNDLTVMTNDNMMAVVTQKTRLDYSLLL